MSIDVRKLGKEGYLDVDARGSLSWTRFDTVVRTVRTEFDCCLGRLWLTSELTSGTGETLPHRQLIQFTYTNCNYGGDRTWFRCPYCDRTCALLWGGEDFACGRCCRLAYSSQRLQSHDLAIQRARQIRDALGVPMNIQIARIPRPKYMRYDRFRTLILKLVAAESAWCARLVRFGVIWPLTADVIDEPEQAVELLLPDLLAA